MYFNRTLSFMQNVFSAANLKKIFQLYLGMETVTGARAKGKGEVYDRAQSAFQSLLRRI